MVWLDNVLEHVADPAVLLRKAAQLTCEGGMLIIEVTNDYSSYQQALFDSQKVNRKTKNGQKKCPFLKSGQGLL